MKKIIIILFFLCFPILVLGGFNPNEYTYSQILNENPKYTLYWIVQGTKISIALELVSSDNRWIGFGLSEPTSGSMPGSDVVTAWLDSNGNGQILDRYATAFATPQNDICQDWLLETTYNENGRIVFELVRNLKTSDTQDRDFVSGENKVVWAIGRNSNFTYHQFRGVATIIFFGNGTNYNLPLDAVSMDFRMPNITVPSKKTSYICQSFSLPQVNDASIIMIEPLINNYADKDFVHHLLVHVCEPGINGSSTKTFWDLYKKAGECYSPVGDLGTGCISILNAWAVGMGPLILPPEAGFRMGSQSPYGIKHIILEIHYDNIQSKVGVLDSSGVRIWYTPTVRKYDAGVLTLGDVVVSFPPIPPNNISHYETNCPEECTLDWHHDIHVFADFLHLHQTGKQIFSTQYRDGKYIGDLNRIDFYSFDFQQNVIVDKIIQKGDRINTHCVYDTTSKTSPTYFGLASEEEMCLEFISYYPILLIGDKPYTFCGSATQGSGRFTWCGTGVETSIKPLLNPTIPDPPQFLNIEFGKKPGQCDKPEASWNSLPFSAQIIIIIAAAGVGIALIVTLIVVVFKTKHFFSLNKYQRLE